MCRTKKLSCCWMMLALAALGAPRVATAQEAARSTGAALGGSGDDGGGATAGLAGMRHAANSPDYAATATAHFIQQAFENNPDIKVAEAKLREAEAILHQVRMQTSRQVVESHERFKSLSGQNHAAQEGYKKGVVTMSEMLAIGEKLAVAKADLEYCLGTRSLGRIGMGTTMSGGLSGLGVSSGSGLMGEVTFVDIDATPAIPAVGQVGGGGVAASGGAPTSSDATPSAASPDAGVARPTESAAPQRVTVMLAMPTEGVQYVDLPLSDVVGDLSQRLKINVLIDRTALGEMGISPDQSISLMLSGDDLTWRDVLDAIEELHEPLRFVPRRYGLLVTTKQKALSGQFGGGGGFGGGMMGGGAPGGSAAGGKGGGFF